MYRPLEGPAVTRETPGAGPPPDFFKTPPRKIFVDTAALCGHLWSMTFDDIPSDMLLPRREAAKALTDCGLPVSAGTLATKACLGGGPPYRKFGKLVIYTWGTLVEWAVSELAAPAERRVKG